MNTTSNTINQNQLVMNYLRRNSRRRLTSEQIATAVNQQINKEYPKSKVRLTTEQIRKCLTRFSERNMVKRTDNKGLHSNGRKASRWTLIPTSSRKATRTIA